jgi:hypothetical protein
MGKRPATKREPKPDPTSQNAAPPQSGEWPRWACWVVSALLLFHITSALICEAGGQVFTSDLERDIAGRFWWYSVSIHQEIAHAYFAPEPDPAIPVVKARLEFATGPDRVVRLPDPATWPRIRYLRQLALGWHLVHEWSEKGPVPRSCWAESFAQHLCRANPGCTRVALSVQYHQMPDPRSVVRDVARGKVPDLDDVGLFTREDPIGAFACKEP